MKETQTDEKRGSRKERNGIVVSDKQDKTIIVETVRRMPHPLFKKIIKKKSKFVVHDEKNEAKIGDMVLIAETRPTSKSKRWRLVKVVSLSQKIHNSGDGGNDTNADKS
jgi:small subunit ribosomal protein S17